MSLQTFIIQENLRLEYAERLNIFQERYNHQVLLDLKDLLEKNWDKLVKIESKRHIVDNIDSELAIIKNPKAVILITLEKADERIITTRHREAIEVSPSIKIPLLLKTHVRDFIIKSLFDTAESTFIDIADKWKEIFRVEKNGRATPWFKIIRDSDEIRFQLILDSTNENTKAAYKTLYSIRIEYGKNGSKTKDFDRIYLISLI